MASDAQPDNITDGPDIQRLRSIRLDEDPGLMWPHQMRFEVRIFFFSSPERNDPPRVQEVKRRIGEPNARLIFSKLKAMDKADKAWRTEAICKPVPLPWYIWSLKEFQSCQLGRLQVHCSTCPQPGLRQMVHINWVTGDLVKQTVQQAYAERARANHAQYIDRRPELPQPPKRPAPAPGIFASRPRAVMTARPLPRMMARPHPYSRRPPSPPSHSSPEEDSGDSDASADMYVDEVSQEESDEVSEEERDEVSDHEVEPDRVRQGKPLDQRIYANRWGHHSVTGERLIHR
ncbi:hypothetical protein BDZ89DRAFT_1144172 [Hymenopellis radicata]|nr:hypothetical protein BDZ89DRAFT_1144172 [Hymenopellis radicata]